MLAGVARARRRFEGMKFILVGDEERIRAGLQNHPKLTVHSEIVHAPDMIGSSERPSQAIRRAKTTSMGIAHDMVKQGRAGAAVSSGNTDALMAMDTISTPERRVGEACCSTCNSRWASDSYKKK